MSFVPAARVLRALAIALWVGALAGFAFLFAPIAFHTIGPTAQFAAMIAATLRALTAFGWACALVALGATFAIPGCRKRGTLIFGAIVAAMALLGLYEVIAVIPAMETLKLQTPAYAALHKTSSLVYGAALLLGLIAIAMISVRDIREGND